MAPDAYRTPVYQQIADDIRRQIETGVLGAGDPVHSLTEIKLAWGVSQRTAQRALQQLRDLILVRPGVPTIVVPSRLVPADALVAEALQVGEGVPVRMQVADDSALFTRVPE